MTVWNDYIKKILYSIVLIFFIEVFIFNYKHWNSLLNSSYEVNLDEFVDNMSVYKDDKGILIADAANYLLYIDSEFDDINNIGITSYVTNGYEEWFDYIGENKYTTIDSSSYNASLYINKDRYTETFRVSEKIVGNSEGKFDYISFSNYKEVSGLALKFEPIIGDSIKIERLVINTLIPMEISWLRLAILFVCSCIFMCICEIERRKLDFYNNKWILSGIILVNVVLISCILFSNKEVFNNNGFAPYCELARAFSSGKLSILRDVPEWLINANNPYDPDIRAGHEARIMFDYAYYNGHYYVYFGIVPCILFYLPYYMLTRHDLLNVVVVYFLLVAWIVANCLLLRKIGQLYFKKISFITFFVVQELMLLTGGIFVAIYNVSSYLVPQLSGMLFVTLGMLWYISLHDETGHNGKKLFGGSVCMALVAGCRPQMLLSILIIVPFVWRTLFDNKVHIKERLKRWSCFALPYMVVAIMLMIYNYLRFDSVFEFGARYNLTSVNVYDTAFSIDKIWNGIFYYCLSVPILEGRFPYVKLAVFDNSVMSSFNAEELCGGIFFFNITLICGFFIGAYNRRNEREKTLLKAFNVLLLVVGGSIVIVDTLIGGLMFRYCLDFGYFFAIAAGLVIMQICSEVSDKSTKTINATMLIILFVVFGLYFLSFLGHWCIYKGEAQPDYFARIINSLCFWR